MNTAWLFLPLMFFWEKDEKLDLDPGAGLKLILELFCLVQMFVYKLRSKK